VLPQMEIEAALDRILMVGGPKRLNQLRDHARDELHVKRASPKPNHHSNRVPRGLPAALKGLDPQQNCGARHQFVEPRAALVGSL
jgi:hypothetical protein